MSLEIYKRVDVPGYVLFYVGIAGEPPEARKMAVPLAVKQENKRWWLTHDLRANPVLTKDFRSFLFPEGAVTPQPK